MGPSFNLAEISTFYYNFPLGPHFSDKLKVSNLDLKLCPHRDLYETSLSTKFQNLWMNYLRHTSILAKKRFFMDIVLCMDILENPYLRDNLFKDSETL